jgi:hypothetical protein
MKLNKLFIGVLCISALWFIFYNRAIISEHFGTSQTSIVVSNLITNGTLSSTGPAHIDTETLGKYQLVHYDKFNAVSVGPSSYYQLNVAISTNKDYKFSCSMKEPIVTSVTFWDGDKELTASSICTGLNENSWSNYEYVLTKLSTQLNKQQLSIRLQGTNEFTNLCLDIYSPVLNDIVAMNDLKTFLGSDGVDIANAKAQVWRFNNPSTQRNAMMGLLYKTSITGPSSEDVFGTNTPTGFTIVFKLKINSSPLKIGSGYDIFLDIPGNNNSAIKILFPVAGENLPIQFIIADTMYQTETVVTSSTNYYTITYNQADQKINVWLNDADTPIGTFMNIPKIYFNKSAIKINPSVTTTNYGLNAQMFSFIIYSRDLQLHEIASLLKYLQQSRPLTIAVTELNAVEGVFENFESIGATVHMENNNYMMKNGRFGTTINLGPDIIKARKLYEANYGKHTSMPELLKSDCANNCPFRLDTDGVVNPCYIEDCSEVDWKSIVSTSAIGHEISNTCKKSVSNYCSQHGTLDDNDICKAWSTRGASEEVDTLANRKMRTLFENPLDYQCDISEFDIKQHPELGNYILKKNIPCFNCNIE